MPLVVVPVATGRQMVITVDVEAVLETSVVVLQLLLEQVRKDMRADCP